jgi:hypothetical protein
MATRRKPAAKPAEKPEVDEGPFPSWRYGPGGLSKVCQSSEDVPEGWADHPSKVAAEPLDL